MADDPNKFTSANPEDLADSLAFALRFSRGERVHNADESMSRIVARRLGEHLRMSGYIVMKGPPTPPHSTP